MHEQWYGDNRDLVKWGGLLHLARARGVRVIHQIALRRDRPMPGELEVGEQSAPIPREVLDHFRNLRRIEELGPLAGVEIRVLTTPLTQPRARYFDQVIRRLDEEPASRRPLIAFLDPDTGLAPRQGRASLDHVTPDEVRHVFDALGPTDVLALYQHARRDRRWIDQTRQAFASALGRPPTEILTIRGPGIARDVVLHVCER